MDSLEESVLRVAVDTAPKPITIALSAFRLKVGIQRHAKGVMVVCN
jgi:hypothetical protein